MQSKLFNYINLNRNLIFASLIALVTYGAYKFIPIINTYVSVRSLSEVVHTALLGLISTGLFCTVIALSYRLLGVKNSILSALVGFAATHFVITWVYTLIKLPVIVLVISVIIAFFLFFIITKIIQRLRLPLVVSIFGGAIILLASIFLTSLSTGQIVIQQTNANRNLQFSSVVNDLNFTIYYPTYKSIALPASAAKLNGYIPSKYTTQSGSFTLGKAQVEEFALLTNQSQVMNFKNNCDILAIKSSAGIRTYIPDLEIQQSNDNFKKCDLVATTPSGKNVYFRSVGQFTDFYTLIGKTNFILEFDSINSQKYDPAGISEVLKIIDSLQPIDKSQLKIGNTIGIPDYE